MTAQAAQASPPAAARGDSSAFGTRHRSITIILGMALVTALLPLIVTLPPFNGFNEQRVWIDSFATAGIFVLLALGLNVVVGMAGLLDLGYAAFFAIGAYAYAYGASSFTGLHIPFWIMLPIGAVVAAVFGILLGAPTLRLRGDYLAIVTLGFGEIVPIVFRNASRVDQRHQRHRGHRPASHPGRRLRLRRTSVLRRHQPAPLLHDDGGDHHRRPDPALPAPGFAPWPFLAGDPRGRAGGGQQRHQHRHHQAAGLRPRRHHGRLRRRVQRLQAGLRDPRPVRFTVSFTVLAMVVLGGMGNMWAWRSARSSST